MKITCQSCQSKYTVSDDKVQGKTVKIKCRKCGSTIVVSSNGVTTSNGAGGGGADAAVTAAGTYLVNVSEGDQRSMTLQEIVDAYNSSVVTADTYVWADGMADWAPIGQVEAITSALSSPAPEAAAPRVAARREPARHAQDVFSGGGGGAETQAAADDVATSAPLFGKGSGAAAKPKTGEENSMLFSLSALTAKAAPAGASGVKGPANTEDSGIIDLKALAAAAEARAKTQAAASTPPPASGLGALMPDEGGLFLAPPVLSAAPAAPAVVAPIEAPQKNRTPLFIGIGATVAVAAIVGAFMVMKGGGEPPPVAATESAPTAAPTPTPEPTPPPVAEPTPTATATASAVAAKGGTYKPPAGGGKAPAGSTAKAPAGGAPPAGGGAAPAPAPKKSSCGCAPGDLMCAMKCSTK
jgi:predicted Zn finger-like uncharacterized protein